MPNLAERASSVSFDSCINPGRTIHDVESASEFLGGEFLASARPFGSATSLVLDSVVILGRTDLRQPSFLRSRVFATGIIWRSYPCDDL
jgi:hypothetical protein